MRSPATTRSCTGSWNTRCRRFQVFTSKVVTVGSELLSYLCFNFRNLDTLIHLLKGSLGSGILAMPLAFANAGLFFGVFATVLVGAICTYCVHMLVSCAHTLYRRMKYESDIWLSLLTRDGHAFTSNSASAFFRVPTLDYAGVAEAAFLLGPDPVKKYRRLAKACIDSFLFIDLYGCCCVYVVFVARNLKQVWVKFVIFVNVSGLRPRNWSVILGFLS